MPIEAAGANDQIFDNEESRREAAAASAEIRSRQGFSSGPRNSALNLQPAAVPPTYQQGIREVLGIEGKPLLRESLFIDGNAESLHLGSKLYRHKAYKVPQDEASILAGHAGDHVWRRVIAQGAP